MRTLRAGPNSYHWVLNRRRLLGCGHAADWAFTQRNNDLATLFGMAVDRVKEQLGAELQSRTIRHTIAQRGDDGTKL
jgi:hypothetical protein